MFTKLKTALWGTVTRRVVTSAITLVVAIAAGGGGVAIANAVAHGQALERATAAHAAAAAAADEYRQLRDVDAPAAADAAGTLELEVTPLLTSLAGAVDDVALEDLAAAIAAVAEVRTTLDEHAAPTLPRVGAEPAPSTSTADLEAARTDLASIEADYLAAADELVAVAGDVTDAADAAGTSLRDVAATAADGVLAAIAAAPSANQGSKDAATAAAELVVDEEADVVERLTEYAAAIAALRAAHDAEEARKAQEAASGASGGSQGGGSPGGGSPGGGTPGGGGPTTPPPPADTNRYADPRGPYTPGCELGGVLYSHDPGPGGTSVINSVSIPYDYRISGNNVVVYACR